MQILAIGINHKTAPIEIREMFYLNPIQQDLFLSELKSNPAVAEACILSTCNRTELYLHVIEGEIEILQFIKMITDIKKAVFDPQHLKYFYTYRNDAAVEQLLKVTSGLDSLVLGETQILGQVKSAVERAQNRGVFSKNFNLLGNIAIRTGKKVQLETNISRGGSSISWAAVHKAERELQTLKDRSTLLIGAGKMGELALAQLKKKGIKNLYLMNRTHAHAVTLAERHGGEAVEFCDMKEILQNVDLCFCSVGAPHYIIEKRTVQKIMALRGQKPLVLIDISMPRNIDPAVGSLPFIKLFTIDDLKETVDHNMKVREKAIQDVELIISQKIKEYKYKVAKFNQAVAVS